MLNGLDRQELVDWVGSTIYSRGNSCVAAVSELSRIEDGRLVAWVSGAEKYVTTVRRDGQGDFDYTCTCPYEYEGTCKHVVAVLLAALCRLERKQEIPLLDPESDLYLELSDFLDDQGVMDDDEGVAGSGKLPEGIPGETGLMLEKKSRAELLGIFAALLRDYPSVAKWLREREQMAMGKIDGIVRSLRKEIRSLTAMDAWSSEWNDYDNLPDYSGVQQQLQALLDSGHADAVFELGKDLFQKGSRQAASSNDDGETATGIAACMKIVLKALPDTRLSPVEQLIWLFDSIREDEADLLYGVDELLDDVCYTTHHWAELATVLEERLRQMSVSDPDSWREKSRRRHLVDQLKDVYLRSSAEENIIPLLEREAEPCMAYEMLVDHLINAGESDRARLWCVEGYGKTVEHASGIAATLKRRLREIADMEGKTDLVAAYRAQDFFEFPSVDTFRSLRFAAGRIGLWPVIRETALDYLQSGKQPFVSGVTCEAWILPKPEVMHPKPSEQTRDRLFRNRVVLMEIAIFEERRDDVVALYTELCNTNMCRRDISEQVADAVSESHPDISLKVWRSTVDNLIAEVKTHAYQEAAGYLRKMRKVFWQADRKEEWHVMISELRTRHKAKRRLMEVLNDVEKTQNPDLV